MQFTTVIVGLFAATAFAAPAQIVDREVDALNTLQAQAQAHMDQMEAAGCHKLKCLAALAPAVASCAAAVAEAGANPIADAGCLASAGNDLINKVSSCKGCHA